MQNLMALCMTLLLYKDLVYVLAECRCRCAAAAAAVRLLLSLRQGEARRLGRGLLSKKTREDGKARKTSARSRGTTCATSSERRREQRLEPLSSERSLNSKALAFVEQTLEVTLTQAPTSLLSSLFSLPSLSSLVFSTLVLSRHSYLVMITSSLVTVSSLSPLVTKTKT